MVRMPTPEEIAALQRALADALRRSEELAGELRVVRTERDLLESVLYPSASFVRSYEPVIVTTKSGDEQSGVLRKDSADEVILGTGANLEVRIPRSDVAEMRPGTVSVMPQGLDQQISKQELADLIAFLKATKW